MPEERDPQPTTIVYRKDDGEWQGQTDPGPLDGWEAVEVSAETWERVRERGEWVEMRRAHYEKVKQEEAEAREELRQEIEGDSERTDDASR